MKLISKMSVAVASMMLAACGDSTVAPRSTPVTAANAPSVAGQGSTQALTSIDTLQFSITIQPFTPTIFPLGQGNSIVFPAASVCDPASSNYGAAYWDTPCAAATVPVTVNVKAWLDGAGHVATDFSPNIRFVPSALPTGWVSVSFSDSTAAQSPMFKILYCSTPGNATACADESSNDPSLTTYRNPITGQLSRRIKHFSGYMVGAGRDDGSDSGMDRTSQGSPAVTAVKAPTQKGGYVLVSGRTKG